MKSGIGWTGLDSDEIILARNPSHNAGRKLPEQPPIVATSGILVSKANRVRSDIQVDGPSIAIQTRFGAI